MAYLVDGSAGLAPGAGGLLAGACCGAFRLPQRALACWLRLAWGACFGFLVPFKPPPPSSWAMAALFPSVWALGLLTACGAPARGSPVSCCFPC